MSIGDEIRSVVSVLGDRHVQQMVLSPFTMPFSMARILRERPSLDAVRAELRQALEGREQRFLKLARDRVFNVSGSPTK